MNEKPGSDFPRFISEDDVKRKEPEEIRRTLDQIFEENKNEKETCNVPPEFREYVWAKARSWTVYKAAEQSHSGDGYIKITRTTSKDSVSPTTFIPIDEAPSSSSKRPRHSSNTKKTVDKKISPVEESHEYQVVLQFKDVDRKHAFSVSQLLNELDKAFLSPVKKTPTIFIALCRSITENLDPVIPKKKKTRQPRKTYPANYTRVLNSSGELIAHQYEPGFIFTKGTTKKCSVPENLQIVVATTEGLEELFGVLIFASIMNKAKIKTATQADFPLTVDDLHDEFLHLSIGDSSTAM